MYEPVEEPVEFTFGYTLPDEYGNEIFSSDYVLSTKKWYIEASGHPHFNISFYRGTARYSCF